MITSFNDDKKGSKYEVGQRLKTYDEDEEKAVNGVVTEVGDETICIKWEDLSEETEYERSKICLSSDYLFEL